MKKISITLFLIIGFILTSLLFVSCNDSETPVENNETTNLTEASTCVHDYTGEITLEATCIKSGFKTFTCSICNDLYTEVIPATGTHKYQSKVTTEATCAKAGLMTYTCADCEASYTEAIAITDKHFYESEVTLEATCTEDGVKTYTCSVCEDSYTEAIAAVGAHNYVSKVTVEATCTKDGVKTYTCSVCEDSYTEAIAATGIHNYVSEITTEATCAEDGLKTFTCSMCKDSYTEVIAATGHEWTDATCALPKTCSVCKSVDGDALGHTTNDGICGRCGIDNTNYYLKLRNFILANYQSKGAIPEETALRPWYNGTGWWSDDRLFGYCYKYYVYYNGTKYRLDLYYYEDLDMVLARILKANSSNTSDQIHIRYTATSNNVYAYEFIDRSVDNWMLGSFYASTIGKGTKTLPYDQYRIGDITDTASSISKDATKLFHIYLSAFDKFLNEHLNIGIEKFGFINY